MTSVWPDALQVGYFSLNLTVDSRATLSLISNVLNASARQGGRENRRRESKSLHRRKQYALRCAQAASPLTSCEVFLFLFQLVFPCNHGPVQPLSHHLAKGGTEQALQYCS